MADKRANSPEANGGTELVVKKQKTETGAIAIAASKSTDVSFASPLVPAVHPQNIGSCLILSSSAVIQGMAGCSNCTSLE